MRRSIEESSVEKSIDHWIDANEYLVECKEPIGIYTLELIQAAESMGRGGMMVHMTSNGAMYLCVGQWVETTDSLLNLIVELKGGHI